MWGCCGFSFTGSGSGGFTSTLGGILGAFGAGGGGGGGATGISVTGCDVRTDERNFTFVFMLSGYKSGTTMAPTTTETCRIALSQTRLQRDFPSGRRARRAGTGRVPMFCFQAGAAAFPLRLLAASKPTPSDVFLGRSTIMVVIRVTPRATVHPVPDSEESGFPEGSGRLRCQYEGT